MSSKQRSYLSNMNRLFIFALTVTGLLMDGYQSADIFCTSALVVWLWQPVFIKFEAKALKYINAMN